MSVEHKRPLYAFAVLVVVCGLFLGHALRSDALAGVFRAVVVAAAPPAPATQVVVKEPEPAPAANVVAPAAPVVQAVRRAPAAPHSWHGTKATDRHAKSGGRTDGRDRDRGPNGSDTPTDVPTDTTDTGNPTSSPMRSTYFRAAAGRSPGLRHAVRSSLHPGSVSYTGSH